MRRARGRTELASGAPHAFAVFLTGFCNVWPGPKSVTKIRYFRFIAHSVVVPREKINTFMVFPVHALLTFIKS